MKLMKHAPKQIAAVTGAMPPVEDEARDEIADRAAAKRRPVSEVEQRATGEASSTMQNSATGPYMTAS